jgi:hypothetical protein
MQSIDSPNKSPRDQESAEFVPFTNERTPLGKLIKKSPDQIASK